MSDLSVRAIIVAGGQGRRMGGEVPKQYQMLSGRPLICHTLDVFQSHSSIDSIALVVNAPIYLLRIGILTVLAVGLEQFSKKGIDNITVPIVVAYSWAWMIGV